ncbi:MAG: DNA-directed RNA polymerase subunit alpha C-terminal domain-containing protein [Tepidiformaceae bacterium]
MIAPVDPPRLTRAQKIAAALEDNALESSPTTERYVTFNDDAEAVESVKTEDVSDSDSGDSLVVLGLAQRSVNALEAAGFSSVEQIVGISDDELLAVKGFGPKALEQLDDALQEHGFSRLAEGSEEDNG